MGEAKQDPIYTDQKCCICFRWLTHWEYKAGSLYCLQCKPLKPFGKPRRLRPRKGKKQR